MWYHKTHCAPLLLLGKHRCDNLARTRLSATYPAWPTWQLQWCVPAAHPRLWVVEVHRFCPSRTPKGKKVTNGQVRWSRGPLAEHLVILCSAVNPSVWQVLVEKRADSEMPVQYLQSHIYKNIPVSFDFVTTWNQGVFLCSLCIFRGKNLITELNPHSEL